MKAETSIGPVYVRWEFSDPNTRQSTTCYAEQNRQVIAKEKVTRYYKDTENKETARVASLGKLIKTLFPNKAENNEDRAAIWNAYRNRKTGSKKEELLIVH